MTKYYNWKNGINSDELQEVKKIIEDGGVIIFPTDTVYGIGCSCMNKDAIKKIFTIKNRPLNKPINVLTDNISKIEKITKNITPKERELIDKYMPGALTIILDKSCALPEILTSSLPTVGVRIPNSEIALKILEASSVPLATTSANPSGEDAGIKLDDFKDQFDGKVDAIIDGGETFLKVASTIVRVEDNNIKILRQGTLKV